MEKSDKRLLLNAEPFGFGPTAAIATFFPYLRERFETIGYVGRGHTLDLQRELPYDSIDDLTEVSAEDRDEKLREIFARHDVLLTALDFSVARKAKDSGLNVAIYDSLTWYWPEIPEVVAKSDLYVAQNFFGVEERMELEAQKFSKTRVVPPITNDRREQSGKSHVLINLGGLKNPYMTQEEVIAYAKVMTDAICSVIPDTENVVITTSNGVVESLVNRRARTYSREEMMPILANARYAFMTPGLGNIYDAAHHKIPTVWLPPANDSQGQQLVLLKQNKMFDGSMDWGDCLEMPIDYFRDQQAVLRNIAQAINKTLSEEQLQYSLRKCAERETRRVTEVTESSLVRLTEKFGTGGAMRVADYVYELALGQKK